jgi:iron complex outermembrane receptor protein
VGLEWAAQATARTTLVLGASLDGTATPLTGGAPRPDPLLAPGLTVHLTHGLAGALTLKAAAGRKVRFPTPRERFGAALGRFVPNPDLRPETALVAEAGLAWDAGRGLRAEATAFLNRTYGTLDQRTLAEGRRQRVNLRGSRVVGVEGAARAAVAGRLRLDGHLTWTYGRALTDPMGADAGRTRLAERPAWLGTLAATLALPARLALLVQPRLVAGAYAPGPDGAFARLPDAVVLDARLAHRLPAGRGRVFVRVDNVTDAAAFFQRGLPAPGRTLRMGMEVTL